LIMAFSGCRAITPPVTYYTLSPIRPDQAAIAGADAESPLTIGIYSVELPGYFNRAQMVRRIGLNQLEISSLHRWADYPDQLVQHLLAENLQTLLPHARVVNAPWVVSLKPDMTVSFQFFDLVGGTDNRVELRAAWTIVPKDASSPTTTRRTTLSELMTDSGFDELAAAHSRVLAALCRQVAESMTASQD
jgi:uncharacterized lipoprotein YmbA